MGLGRVSLVSSLGQGKAIATSTNFCQAVGTRLEDKVVWCTPHQTTPSVLASGLMELHRGWSGSSATNGFGLLGLGFLGLRAQAVLDRLEDPLVRVWFVFFFRVCSGLAWAMSVECHFRISFLRGLCRFWLLGCLDWLGPSTVFFWLFCFGFGSLSGACLFASPSWGSVLVLVGWLTG